MHINTETASVTLTFEIGALFYSATRRRRKWKYIHAVQSYGPDTKKLGRTDGRTDGRCDFNMPPKDPTGA